jgi:hypothetical protein
MPIIDVLTRINYNYFQTSTCKLMSCKKSGRSCAYNYNIIIICCVRNSITPMVPFRKRGP